MHWQAASYLCDTLVKVAENSPCCTMGSVQGNLKPPKFSTGSGKRTLKYRAGSVAWNKLPLSIKHPLPPNKSIFKHRLNDYLYLP